MNNLNANLLEPLKPCVMTLLEQHPQGLGEYELIKALQREYHIFPDLPLTRHLVLFRMHFLLHHTLYHLRDELWAAQRAHLDINPLCTVLRAYHPHTSTSSLVLPDPLRSFYMDLSHLDNMTEVDVVTLLAGFWKRFNARRQLQDALTVLAQEGVTDYADIKTQYRRLVMQHHPDRGGDKAQLQAINHAMHIIDDYYQSHRID